MTPKTGMAGIAPAIPVQRDADLGATPLFLFLGWSRRPVVGRYAAQRRRRRLRRYRQGGHRRRVLGCCCRRCGLRRLRRADLQWLLAHRQQQIGIVHAMAIADTEIQRRCLGLPEQLSQPRLAAAREYTDWPEIGAEWLEVPDVRPERGERNAGVVLHDVL